MSRSARTLVVAALLAAVGGAADAGTVRTPVQVGVTVTKPCEIAAPLTISLDADGRPTVKGDALGTGCGVVPQVAVAADISKGAGYVVSISF